MSDIRLFLDYSCPWSYLALLRLRDVTDRNAASFELRPVVVAEVLATENPALADKRLDANPAKAAWQEKDLQDWASMWGLRLELPAGWPAKSDKAAVGAAIAIAAGKGFDYSQNVYRRYFADGADITDPAVLADCAADAGLAKDEFSAALKQTEHAKQVKAWTEELIRSGGFGTPSVFVGDELFFGNDRIPLVDWRISPMSTGAFVAPGQHG